MGHEPATENLLWGLSYITDSNAEIIQRILKSDMLDLLLDCLKSPANMIQIASLRTVGNLLTSSAEDS
jgi:hypothetical protein